MDNHLIPLTNADDGDTAVMGRDLHAFLGIGQDYTNWFKRMQTYGFAAGQDYLAKSSEVARSGRGTVSRTDHILTLDMAKEVAMIQRTERGKQARQYFIEVEKQHRAQAPAIPQTYSDALRAAADAEDRAKALEARAVEDAPKVDYHDTFVAESDQLSFRSVASTVGLTEKFLRELLIDRKWIYKEETSRRSQKTGEIVPQYRYSEYADKKPYFLRRQNHDAPRFRGEVDHTLKITPAGAAAIHRALNRWLANDYPAGSLPFDIEYDETVDHS